MLLDTDQIKGNFSKFSTKYDDNSSVQANSSRILVSQSLEYAKIDSDSKILDLGSGTGNIAKFIKEITGGGEVTACDFSETMLQYDAFSSKKICCDLNDFPTMEKESFSHIYSSFCLQWLSNNKIKDLIDNMYEICTDNGIFCFSMPVAGSFKEFNDANKTSNCNFRLIDLPNSRLIKEIVDNSSFKVLEVSLHNDKVRYSNAIEFLKKIKSSGANYSFKNEQNFLNRKKIKKISDILFKKYDNYITWDVLNYYLIKINKNKI